MCLALNISKRALQTYRDNGLIPYSNIGGKFFYKEVDIQQILEEGLIKKKDSEEFKELTGWIKRTGKNLEAAAARIRPTIADEHYLSGDEVCRMLHVSKRTLQTLRDEKAIPYTSITSVGGKLLYPESGLYEVLKKNYKDFRRYLK